MPAHCFYGRGRVPGAQCINDRAMISLIPGSSLAGGTAALQVPPDVPVPCLLDDPVERDEQRTVTGGHDAVMQGQVPALEFLETGRAVSSAQAAVHLFKIRSCRPRHHPRHRRPPPHLPLSPPPPP